MARASVGPKQGFWAKADPAKTARQVGILPSSHYLQFMHDDLKEKLGFSDLTEPSETKADDHARYDDWKRRKVEAALQLSENRSAMIPAKKVWERFGFER